MNGSKGSAARQNRQLANDAATSDFRQHADDEVRRFSEMWPVKHGDPDERADTVSLTWEVMRRSGKPMAEVFRFSRMQAVARRDIFRESRRCIMVPVPEARRRCRWHRPERSGRNPEWVSREQTDPAVEGGQNVDIKAFMDTLSEQDRFIVSRLLTGVSARAIGRELGTSHTPVNARVAAIREAYQEFMGEDEGDGDE